MVKKICVIGAGPSGLVAAKTFHRNSPAGTFHVTIYESRDRLGGLWPIRKDDPNLGGINPLMVANQSKHTMQFSDFAWDATDPEFPFGWQVGRYLERYAKHHGIRDIHLRKKVDRAELLADRSWKITARSIEDGTTSIGIFDYLVVATGFFGNPVVDPNLVSKDMPWIHSSKYRSLTQLLGEKAAEGNGGKILVVGGQMSGVEAAENIARQISAQIHSPSTGSVKNPEKYTVQHIIQRPVWVFPLFTSPNPAAAAPPFLPLDLSSYNLANRETPLVNAQGHISEAGAQSAHSIMQRALGGNQAEFHDLLRMDSEDQRMPPYLTIGNYYLNFVREGLIAVDCGRVKDCISSTTRLSTGLEVNNVVAAVLATGYNASSGLGFLPRSVLEVFDHSPENARFPLALSFHATHHPDVRMLGFVGFYRSPYWGVMEMQARFLSALWSGDGLKVPSPLTSIEYAIKLRDDPRASQFPMGDYAWLMQEFSDALSIPRSTLASQEAPKLTANNRPMNILTPSRYLSQFADEQSNKEALKSLEQTQSTANTGLTSSKFVARGIFRSLLGTWILERDITSRSRDQQSGHFSGVATFNLREGTKDGLQCLGDTGLNDEPDLEYLYVEEGTFIAENGLRFTATRRYVWRYDEAQDILSVWFVKPTDPKRVDYLFHELEFTKPNEDQPDIGWLATAGHLCEKDYYGVQYDFRFRAVNLVEWTIEYSVTGPRKDYTLRTAYRR